MDPQPTHQPPGARDGRHAAVIVVVVTTLLILIETSRNYVNNALFGRRASWMGTLAFNAPTWIFIALLTPLPLGLARRFPITRSAQRSRLAVHLAGALAFAALHIFALAMYASFQRSSFAGLGIMISKSSASAAVDIMMYAAIVGAWHALQFYREARARELAASQLQASLTEARLEALRGQLNPHFLFNTLNAISTMALAGQQESVVRTLGYLGELLRVSLDDTLPQEVPLRDEMEFLERYLDIQRTRFGDRLTVRHDIAPDALDAMVPSMILQPFVENAVTHGISKVPGPGAIRIHARRDNGSLVIDVDDTGPGFTDAKAASGGIGLTNTRARLAQLYGSAHMLTLGMAPGGGGRVSVSLPFRHAREASR